MRRRGRRTIAAVMMACACAAAPARAAAPLVRAGVDPWAHGTSVARHFLGFSLSYHGLLRFTGNPRAGVNPAAVGMLANLADAGQGEPALRIGGSTSDAAWWNPGALPRPDGVTIDLGPFARDSIAAFERATRAPLILGVNFAGGRIAYARDWARVLLRKLPRGTLDALEVGNEPESYPLDHRRPADYSLARYARELRPFTAALRRLPGHPRLAAPATCCGTWERQSARLVRSQRGRIGLLAYHAFATDACGRARPALDGLLGDAAFRSAGRHFGALRAQARRARRPVRITALSSASCGGRAGISDTYATSLWLADWLFLLAAQRFEGANVQVGGIEAPFAFGYANGGFVGRAGPEYYAMLLFARAIADRARLLIPTTLAQRSRRGVAVHVWATSDHSGHARVVVINKDALASGDAVITVRHARGPAVLERLTAPSLGARGGIALGGRRIPAGTTDGLLAGSPATETVTPRGRTYRFAMPPASAALLSVSIPAEPAG